MSPYKHSTNDFTKSTWKLQVMKQHCRQMLPCSISLFSLLLQAKTQEAFLSEQLHSWSLTCILITVSLHQSQVSKHVFERLKKTLQESSSACSVHVGATSLMCLRLKVTQWPKRSVQLAVCRVVMWVMSACCNHSSVSVFVSPHLCLHLLLSPIITHNRILLRRSQIIKQGCAIHLFCLVL